jgi:predicted HTH domain antitoxin
MELTLPKPLEARVTERVAALGLAIGMFVTEEATLGQAAEIAGLSQAEMLKELGRRRIAIHYGPEELAEDLQTLDAFRK